MEREIAEFERLFREENDFILQESARRVAASLVRLTPVDTGAATSDWDVAINSYPTDTEHLPDPRKASTRQRLQEVAGRTKIGDYIVFQNDDEIAVRLEYGYSKQAPQGMVRLTARRWRGFVRGAATAALARARKKALLASGDQ